MYGCVDKANIEKHRLIITEVKFASCGKIVDYVNAFYFRGGMMQVLQTTLPPLQTQQFSRDKILENLVDGWDVTTEKRDDEGTQSDKIIATTINGKRYLKTEMDVNDEEVDDIGDLPKII